MNHERHDCDWVRHATDGFGDLVPGRVKAFRRIEEAKAAEKPKPKPRRPRALPESTREILDHWAADKRKQ